MKSLKPLAYELTDMYASQIGGEDYHELYKKNKERFRLLISSDLKLARGLTRYFKDLSGRVVDQILWYDYNRRVAAITDLIKVDWVDENIMIKVLLTEALLNAVNAGGESTQDELDIDIGWSSKDNSMIKFLDKYSLKLAGNLTDTTKDKIKLALQTAINNKETQQDAAARISAIINDPKRAQKIAHTEAIRAFSAGRLEVARQVGAEMKRWSTVRNPCPICRPLEGVSVRLDELFPGGFMGPPAHPNCNCIPKIDMPKDGIPLENDWDLVEKWEDYPFE